MATSAGDEAVTEVSQSEPETVKSPETGKSEETEEKTTSGQSTKNEQPEEAGQAEETKKATVETGQAEETKKATVETDPGQAADESVTVLKAGLLTKQGGSYRSWKKYYFVLSDSSLSYYKKEGDTSPKRRIDLTTGRGVRTREQCEIEWPKSAKPGLSFGVATEERTFYIYGDSETTIKEWMTLIQQCINKVGKPNDDYKNDPEGKPEGKLSKIVKGGAKLASKVTKIVVKNAGVDEDVVNVVEGVADAVENQADADRDATLTDRLKMAAGDTAGVVGDNVDNAYVSVATDVVQEQCEADADTSIQQRVLMGAGTAIQGTGAALCEEGEGNQDMIAGGVLLAAGKVIKDQGEADEELSIKQRVALAGGSAIGGTGEALGATLGEESQPIVDTLDVASSVVKDQATTDEDTSLKDRGLQAISSATGAVGELDSVKDTQGVKEATDVIQQAVEEAQSSDDKPDD